MPKEWVDVVDTAVKIGLGSLITGIFTYIGIKFSHKSERSKFMLEHKTKLLEQVADDIEEFFASWDSFVSVIGGITKIRKNEKIEDEELETEQWDSIIKHDEDLINSKQKYDSSIAKLRLLKASQASRAMISAKALVDVLRSPVMFDDDIPKHSTIVKYLKRVKGAKENVHKALADYYATLST